ncbi:MAG: flippase [Bacteroidetes bacterium]|nr:flippase [Bacteroidota bacterium]
MDRVVRLVGAVVVNAWLTRYLGPDQNGVMNFALAFVGMFTPLAVLGMDAIVVRDLVRDPEKRDDILGSAFGLRLMGACSALLFAALAIVAVRPDDTQMQLLVIISAAGMVFQSFDVIDYWFQSQVQSKYTVYAKNTAFVVIGGAKIAAILGSAGLTIFILLSAAELLVSAAALVIMYRVRGNRVRGWTFRFDRAKALLVNSWPIIISDLAVFMQARIDQVMIGEYLTNADVGVYAAAQKISEPVSVIPMIIMSSIYPVIVRTKEWSEEEYHRRLTDLYRLMFIISVTVCLPIAVLSGPIVRVLYGEQFAVSATLLSLLIWTRFYAFFGVARSIFISTENLFRHALICSVAGVSVSIIANYLLIRHYGVYGSIIATHLGFLVTIFVVDALSPATKRNFRSMMTGIVTFYRFRLSPGSRS